MLFVVAYNRYRHRIKPNLLKKLIIMIRIRALLPSHYQFIALPVKHMYIALTH